MQLIPHLLWLQSFKSIIDLLPLTVEPEIPLSDVIAQMAKWDTAIAIVANSEQVLGCLSERNVVKLVALGVDLKTTKISEVMNTSVMVFHLAQFADLPGMISLLHQHPSSCLLVVDEQEQLVGTFTSESVCHLWELATRLNNQGLTALEEITTWLKLLMEKTKTVDWKHDLSNNQIFFLNPVEDLGSPREPMVEMSDGQALSESTVPTLGIASDEIALRIKRKQTQEALGCSEERFRNLVEASSDWVWEIDENVIFTYVSPKIKEILGYEPQELLGKSPFQLMPAAEVERVMNIFTPILAAQQPFKCLENTNIHKDGHLVVLETSGVPIFDATRKFCGYRGIDRDISARKLAEESLSRFHKAIESTSDAIIFSDISGVSIYINPAFQELYGYTLDELQASGGMWAIFQEPEKRQQILPMVINSGSWRGEITMRSRDDQILQVDLRIDAIKDSHDRITDIVCIHTNITQRQQVEEVLRLRDRAIDASSNGIIIADASITNGPIIYVNPAFEEMTGYSAEEVIGQNFRLFQSADVDQPGLKELSAAMQSGRACTVVLRNYRKNGTLLWNELNVSPVYDNTGQLRHYIGIQTDITERKQAETALILSQQRLQYLLTSSPGVIYTSKTSGDFDILFVSNNITDMSGYKPEEFTENPLFWSSHIHPEDTSSVFAELAHVLERRHYKLEYRFLHKDGTYRWLYDQGRVMQDDTSNPVEMVGYLIDITERKQLEEDLKVALENEKELSELKSRFVSMTSHEFRTPLSTILSSSELLEHYRHKWTEEKQLTHLHRIQTAVKRMTEMLNDILIIGKAEAGKLEFVVRSFDVVAYCRQLVEETQVNLKHQQIHFTSQHEFMPCCMDDKLLGHILSNLLSNAVKYSPVNSYIQFTFYCRDRWAIFEIQDWGIGIPPDDIPHLFTSFHRANNVGHIIGTGLGLSIVKKCVDIHQGEIFVSSKLGIGSIFTVNIPLIH